MYRPFAVKFLERIGGTGFHISLFYSLPGLMAAMALLPGCMFLSRFKDKKNITSVFFLISRSMVLALAFVPLLAPEVRPFVFVGIIALMNLPEALAQTSLQSYLGDVFSERVRAQAISLRNKFGYMFIFIVALATGFIISFAPKTDTQRIHFYQLFFVLAFVSGLLEIAAFRRFRPNNRTEEATAVKHSVSLASVKAALGNKRFLAFLLPTIVFQFTWQAGWPISAVYQIQALGSSEIWFAMYTVAIGIGAFFSAGFWNKHINKWGNPKALLVASVFMALNMLLMGLSPNELAMTLVSVFAGFSTIGINTTILNGMFLATPDGDRITYLGTYNTFVNLSLFVSPLFASVVISYFGVHAAMFISFGLRLIGSLAIFAGNRALRRFD